MDLNRLDPRPFLMLTRPSPSRRGLKFPGRSQLVGHQRAYKAVPFAKGTEIRSNTGALYRVPALTRPSPSRRGLKSIVAEHQVTHRGSYKAVPFAKGTEMNTATYAGDPTPGLQGRPLREGD